MSAAVEDYQRQKSCAVENYKKEGLLIICMLSSDMYYYHSERERGELGYVMK